MQVFYKLLFISFFESYSFLNVDIKDSLRICRILLITIKMIRVCSVLFLSTKIKIIYFAHFCRFFPTRLYFPILPFCPMEHFFKTAIIFAITVSICYTNEFLKTQLTKNSVFLFFCICSMSTVCFTVI